MTINNIAIPQTRPAQFTRQLEKKTSPADDEKASAWWAFHRPADDPMEKEQQFASINLVTAALKRII